MNTKPKVLLVDDDLFAFAAMRHFMEMEGLQVDSASSVREARERIEANPPDFALLDVMMPLDGHDGQQAGVELAKWIAANHPQVLFGAYTAHATDTVAKFFTRFGAGCVQKPASVDYLVRWIRRSLAGQDRGRHIKSFIVHGRSEKAKLDLKNYLQNTLHFSEPIILHEQPSLGRTIIEKFETKAADVDIVFVLLTPDDIVADSTSAKTDIRRARQNVIFEMGYFLAKLNRTRGKVMLLYEGPLELPSDISGLVYIDISGGVSSAGEEIRRELDDILKTAPR